MCKITDSINDFTATQVPEIFGDLARYQLQVMRAPRSQGPGGGQITGSEAAVNETAIKCQISVRNKSEKDEKSGKIVSLTTHKLTFPVTFEVKTTDRLKILSVGSEPERIFKIIGLSIINGLYKAVCEFEK